jgi:hypothetical protein
MKIPTRAQAEALMKEAQRKNPGAWVEHSRYVARAAEAIAAHHPVLDPEAAFILGYLHDIGRRAGVTDMRHLLDGFNFLNEKGFVDAARICITHSFPLRDVHSVAGKWDCSGEELKFVRDYIAGIELNEYDRLIQLCDALALPTGFCLMEKRLVDVALRYGTNEYSVPRWKAYLDLLKEFEKSISGSIYKLLPGVVEITFGVEL